MGDVGIQAEKVRATNSSWPLVEENKVKEGNNTSFPEIDRFQFPPQIFLQALKGGGGKVWCYKFGPHARLSGSCSSANVWNSREPNLFGRTDFTV